MQVFMMWSALIQPRPLPEACLALCTADPSSIRSEPLLSKLRMFRSCILALQDNGFPLRHVSGNGSFISPCLKTLIRATPSTKSVE